MNTVALLQMRQEVNAAVIDESYDLRLVKFRCVFCVFSR